LAGLLQSWNSKSQRPEASGMAWNSKSEFRLRPLLSLRGELSRCCRQAWNTTGCVHLNHPFPNAYDWTRHMIFTWFVLICTVNGACFFLLWIWPENNARNLSRGRRPSRRLGRCGLACSEMFKELVVFCIGSSS
jgi:hypothetical protein